MILQKHYVLCVLFVLLLTIILFGIGRVVVKMTFGELSEDKEKLIEENKVVVNKKIEKPFIMDVYSAGYYACYCFCDGYLYS